MEIWSKISLAAAAAATLFFVLAVCFQFGVFFVLGYDVFSFFSFSDFVNSAVLSLPVYAALASLTLVLPVALLWDKQIAQWTKKIWLFHSDKGWAPKSTPAKLALYLIYGAMAVSIVILIIRAVYLISDYETISERGDFFGSSAPITFQFIGLIRDLISLCIFIMAISLVRSGSIVPTLWLLAIVSCLFVTAQGMARGVDLLGSKTGYFSLACETPCPGRYKLAFALSNDLILISEPAKTSDKQSQRVQIVIMPRNQVRRMTRDSIFLW